MGIVGLVLGLLTMGGTPVLAQSGSAISSAVPSNAAPSLGQQIDVVISIDVSGIMPPDHQLGSFSASLNWDPDVLAFSDHSGVQAGFTGVVNEHQVSSGRLVFNGARATGAAGASTVLTVTFDVVGWGSSDLDLEYSAMAAAYTFKSLLPLLTVHDGHIEATVNYSDHAYLPLYLLGLSGPMLSGLGSY